MWVYRKEGTLAQQSHVLDPAEVKRKYHILRFWIKKAFNALMVFESKIKAPAIYVLNWKLIQCRYNTEMHIPKF